MPIVVVFQLFLEFFSFLNQHFFVLVPLFTLSFTLLLFKTLKLKGGIKHLHQPALLKLFFCHLLFWSAEYLVIAFKRALVKLL